MLIPHRLLIVAHIAATALALTCCGPKIARPDPLPPTTPVQPAPTIARADGESLADFRKRLEAEERARADAQIAQAEHDATIAIAKIKAQAKVDAEKAKQSARQDFLDSVKQWTGWTMAALAAIGIAALVLSFLPWTTWMGFDAKDAGTAFAFVAGLNLARYILLRYGLLAADIAAWLLIAAMIAAAVALAWMIGKAAIRSKALTAAKVLAAKGDAVAATAVQAVAKGKTSEHPLDKMWRKKAVIVAAATSTPAN